MANFVALPPADRRKYWPSEDWVESDIKFDLDDLLGYEADKRLNLGQTFATVIIKSGYLIREFYGYEVPSFTKHQNITSQTKLLSWSVAKSILHAIVGIAVQDNIVELNECDLFDEWKNDERSLIRLKDLLEMRDGLEFVENYDNETISDVIKMLFGSPAADMSGYALNKPLIHRPSEYFNYSSGTSNIISRLLFERLGGQEQFDSYVYTRLFDVIGMNSIDLKYDDMGVWIASSYAYATARDFAKFGFLYLNSGMWSNDDILESSWVDYARTPISLDPDSGTKYGSLWWILDDEFGTFWADGFEGQLVVVCPKLDVVIVRFGKTGQDIRENLDNWVVEVLNRLR